MPQILTGQQWCGILKKVGSGRTYLVDIMIDYHVAITKRTCSQR